MTIGGQSNGPLPAINKCLHIVKEVCVELPGQIAERHLTPCHPIAVPKWIDAVRKGQAGIGLLGGDNTRGRAIDTVGAQMHAVANDEDQGRLVDWPVPIGQEG